MDLDASRALREQAQGHGFDYNKNDNEAGDGHHEDKADQMKPDVDEEDWESDEEWETVEPKKEESRD